MNDSFNSLPWHDAELLELLIDRRSPGKRDEVRLRVVWPEGGEATLYFGDCYAMAADLNFGVIAQERIAGASQDDHDEQLASIKSRWKLLGVSLEALRCFRLETASTASVIRIYAMHFTIN